VLPLLALGNDVGPLGLEVAQIEGDLLGRLELTLGFSELLLHFWPLVVGARYFSSLKWTP